MSAGDARREALRSFGGIEQTKEIYPRSERTTYDRDRPAGPSLRPPDAPAQSGFSILAILCLTLGIGANAAVFSWIEGILFRPYPAVTHQE